MNNCSGTVDVHYCNFSNGSDLYIQNGSNPSVLFCEFIEGADISVSTNSNPHISNTSGTPSISVSGGSAPTVHYCNFTSSTEAGHFNGCGSAHFYNCSFNDSSFDGVVVYDADGLLFQNCNFNNNGRYGIKFAGTGTGTGTTFTDCIVENNGTNGVYATGGLAEFIDTRISQNILSGGDVINTTGGNFTFTNVILEIANPVYKPMNLLNTNLTISVTDNSGTLNYNLTDSNFSGSNVTLDDCNVTNFSVTDCNFSNGSVLIADNGSDSYIWDCVFNAAGITVDNLSSPNIECEFTIGSNITVDNGSFPDIHDCNFNGGGITVNHQSDPAISTIAGGWIRVCNNSSPQISNVTGRYIRLESGSAPTVEYCTFDSTSTGGLFYGCGAAVFTNCTFEDNTDGIHINDADSLEFTDCYFRNNLLDGIKIEGTGATFFTSCEVENNGDDGIHATGGDLTFTNSLIYNNGCYGMYLPYANMTVPMTITDSLRIESNGLAAIKINPNLVGRLPADSLFVFSDNNPDRVCVMEGYIAEDAVWLKRNYNIYGDIGVDGNVTLQLPADCNLYFDNNTGIEIEGALIADSVNFEPILYGNWKGIHFYYNHPGSILNACKLERAGFRDDTSYGPAGIMIRGDDQDSTVTITGCDIFDGNGHGIYMYKSNPLIENCTISNCDGNGIDIMWSDPIITNNTISLSDSCGIYLGISSEPYIDNCNISGSGHYGIFTYGTSNSGTLKNGSIINNTGPSARIPTEMVKDLSTITISGNQDNHQIEVAGGHIATDAVWYNDYDYIMYGSPFLAEGALTLEAGTVLKFEPGVDMDIRTPLTAIGTPENHIVFTSNQPSPAPGDWEYLYFDYSAEPSTLAYCDILYGGSGGYGSVVFWEHTANFDHCDISHSSSAGMCFWSDATAYITNSEIHHNAEMGVESNPWNSVAHISDTSIHNNGDYAIQAGADEIQFIDDDVVIYDNENNAIKVIGDDVVTGTWYNHDVPYDIEGDINVLNNETLTIEAGIEIRFTGEYSITVEGALLAEGNADSYIIFTKFPDARTNWKNIIFSSPDDFSQLTYCNFSFGGSNANGMLELDNAGNLLQMYHCNVDNSVTNGLYLTNNSSPQLTNCSVINNSIDGIHIADGSIPNFGNNLYEWNHIYDNVGYDFYNGTSNIDAEFVYWGTIDSTDINAEIYDQNDDGALGLVNYSPWTNAEHDTLYYSSYGSISGTVILADGVGNITDVEVTAGGMIVNPDTNGDYMIDGLPLGTYDVTASLINYADSTVTGVIVVGNQNTPDIDFTLYSAMPEADFSATPTYGNQPLEVQFTDLSTNGPSSWSWNFGDGNTSAEQNPVHEFIDWGTFTVSLTATNDNGSDTEIKVDYITVNGKPIADAGPDQTVNEQALVQLDGSGSYDPEGETLTYSWTTPPEIQLSDSTAIQPTFTAPYVSDSTQFTIELIVYDSECYSEASTVIIMVLDIIAIDEKPIPENYTLYASYPNPFKSSAEIEFGLPQHAFVEIKIYDIRGRLVTSLADEYFNEGNHTLTWDASKQKSGLYFYKMIVDGKSYEIKKMILMK